MSLHYIIDGYNVVKQVKFLSGKKLKTGRDGLVRFLELYHPQGSSRNKVTVVFDGRVEVLDWKSTSIIQVLFSKNESADEKIKRMVEHTANPSCVVVVSDDKQIIYYCRSLGAQVRSVKEFLEKAAVPKKAPEAADADDKPELSSEAAADITEYLKDIWLKEK